MPLRLPESMAPLLTGARQLTLCRCYPVPSTLCQILHRTVGLSCYHGDELVSSEMEVVPQRQFTLQEIDLLGRATGFEVRQPGWAGSGTARVWWSPNWAGLAVE